MPNIVIPNAISNTPNEKFHAIWKLTRGMLAAGWRYKASSDGWNKDVTGNDSQDFWSMGGFVNLTQVGAQTGVAASLTVPIVATGTTPPTITMTGTPVSLYNFRIEMTLGGVRGVATFRWSSDGGQTWASLTTSATTPLGASGITITWPNSTYNIDNVYVLNPEYVTVTGLTGITNGQCQGHALTISGATNANLNGTFRIASYISSSSVTIYNPCAFLLTVYPGAGYADAANGAITWTEMNGGSAGFMSAIVNGIVTLTSLVGMTAASVGHRMTIINATTPGNNGTFLIVEYVNANSVKILNPAATLPDGTNGNLHWMERDPVQDTYPLSLSVSYGHGAWINLQGPSTLKIPIGTAAPAFVRGEKITQAATGTEGEVIGVSVDTTGGYGFLVVVPRVNGSGAGPRGWDTSVISAVAAPAGSGVTVTPSAPVIEFVRELVWWKNDLNTGQCFYQCIDQASEAAVTSTKGRFSVMAALATCTPVICPSGATGSNPTTNGFPVNGTFVVYGNAGSGNVTTGNMDFLMANSPATGLMHIMVTNCIEAAGVSQDGSWTVLMGTPSSSFTSFSVLGFQRLDDTEDGDVDPYVLCVPTYIAGYQRNRLGSTSQSSNSSDFLNTALFAQGYGQSFFLGHRRRGFAMGDPNFQEFNGWLLATSTGNFTALLQVFTNPEVQACTFAPTPPRIRESIMVASAVANQKMRKGTLRWWYATMGGNACDTIDSKKWVQWSSASLTASGPIIIGPWDGITTPTQT